MLARAVDAWAGVTLLAVRQLKRLERAASWTVECSFARTFDQVRYRFSGSFARVFDHVKGYR